MKHPLKVVQIASFSGNIGDNLSHKGFSRLLDHSAGLGSLDRIEVRRSYGNYYAKDKLLMNEDFAEYLNKFDLVQIGGGNFLEPFEESPMGIRLPMTDKFAEKLRVPTLFSSTGLVPAKSDFHASDRYRESLARLVSKSNIRVMLRNDGSKDWVDSLHIEGFEEVVEAADFAFLSGLGNRDDRDIRLDGPKRKFVAFNVAEDQLWSAVDHSKARFEHVVSLLAELAVSVSTKKDAMVYFVPHTPQDLRLISHIMNKTPDLFRRERISVAPLIPGSTGLDAAVRIYSAASEVYAMRFHANILALNIKSKLFPIIALDRVKSMLNSVDITDIGVDIRVLDNLDSYNSERFVGADRHNRVEKRIRELNSFTIEKYRSSLQSFNLE